jgi:hypothetical protein
MNSLLCSRLRKLAANLANFVDSLLRSRRTRRGRDEDGTDVRDGKEAQSFQLLMEHFEVSCFAVAKHWDVFCSSWFFSSQAYGFHVRIRSARIYISIWSIK